MILQVISALVENGIDIQHWNVYSVTSRDVKIKREMLMQRREEERRLEEKRRKAEGCLIICINLICANVFVMFPMPKL